MSLVFSEQLESQPTDQAELTSLASELSEAFGRGFSFWLDAGEQPALASVDAPLSLDNGLAELIRAAGLQREAQFIADEDVVAVLAVPLPYGDQTAVAAAPLALCQPTSDEDIEHASGVLGLDHGQTCEWFEQNSVWPADVSLRLAKAVQKNIRLQQSTKRLQTEIGNVSHNLAETYEEISLLYGVTQNLRLSSSDEELGRLALDWLADCLPAEGLALQFTPIADQGDSTYKARSDELLITCGTFPLDGDEFAELLQQLNLPPGGAPFVANPNATSAADWKFPGVRQLIVTPLVEGENVFGWLAAVNHTEQLEFGTIEANLLSSVGSILGVHSGNHELYRQQSEFLARVVQALTSAIDAKDPYTCGHSDRVARVSVRLAKELELDDDAMNTLYMAGLLHDIGKIGIDDNVLRKAGRLTNAEFEHIKMHPELGYRILKDIPQFAHVLPVVLHHHEQWDGKGYPHGLVGDETPLLARIAAVADAYDAMTSDRPYRQGMPWEKVEMIFRAGAGAQWDANVVSAFFAVIDDIREISRRERANLSLDVQQWT